MDFRWVTSRSRNSGWLVRVHIFLSGHVTCADLYLDTTRSRSFVWLLHLYGFLLGYVTFTVFYWVGTRARIAVESPHVRAPAPQQLRAAAPRARAQNFG